MYQNISGAGGKRFEIIEIFALEMGNSFYLFGDSTFFGSEELKIASQIMHSLPYEMFINSVGREIAL